MSYYSYLANVNNDYLSCTRCRQQLYEGILKDSKLYCSDVCYEKSQKKIIMIKETNTNSPIKITKSVSYICNGCKNKYYESERPRIEMYGSHWCSQKCTSSIMFNSFIKRQLNS